MSRFAPVARMAAVTTAFAAALISTAASAQTAAVQPATPFAVTALSDDSLGQVAGREDTHQVALSDQQATVTRNSVGNNVQTGDAKISDNAFQNLSGLSIVSVNTGNNVAMNAAMNVTISIQPAP